MQEGTPVPKSERVPSNMEEVLFFLLDAGNHYPMFRALFEVLPKLDAMFLCDLINKRGHKKTVRSNDGYFLCTIAYLEESYWTSKEQKVRLTRLKEKGLIDVKVRGLPPLRWVKIDQNTLWTYITKAIKTDRRTGTWAEDSPVVRKSMHYVKLPGVSQHGTPPCTEEDEGGGENDTPGTSEFVPNGTIRTGPNGTTKNNKERIKTLSGALSPPAAATAAPDDGGGDDVFDGMGLVTNQQNTPAQKRVTPAPIDRYYAAKLQEALKRRLNYRKAWNQTKWADEFRVLRDTLDQDTDRLEAALDWYCAHAGEEYVPEAFSAGSFRGKFLAVEQQMKRRLADAPLPLSPEAKEVLVRVDHLVWPKGAKLGLPNMVQRSLDNYIAFGNQLRAFSDQMFGVQGHPTRLRLQYANIHSKVKGVYLGGNVSTIRQWVERVHELVADWDDWSGNLKPWAWSVTHKLVQQDVESLGSKVLGTGTSGQKKWADYKREVGL
jgi:hypothetical protein